MSKGEEDRRHSHQAKDWEKVFTMRISKVKGVKNDEIQVVQVSPPFEGGVAGTIDYLMFTRFISRPGWLIYSFLLSLYL